MAKSTGKRARGRKTETAAARGPRTNDPAKMGLAAPSSSAYGIGSRIFQLADIDIELGEAFNLSGLPTMRQASQRLAHDFARAEVAILDEEGKPLPRAECLKRPGYRLLTGMSGSYGLTSFRFRAWECLCAQRIGHAESFIRRDDYGSPVAIQPLKPGLLEYRIEGGMVAYYLGGERVDEMALLIQQWDVNEANAWFGLSPMETCREALRTEAHRASIYRGIVDSGYAGKVKAEIPNVALVPTVRDELQDKYAEQHNYKSLSGKLLIGQQSLEFAPLVDGAADKAVAARNAGVQEMASITDLPPGMLGLADGRTADDIRDLYADALDCRLAAFADAYSFKLLPPGERFVLLSTHARHTGAKAGYRGLAMLRQLGVISVDEARARMGGILAVGGAEGAEREVLVSGVTGQNAMGAEGDGENGGAQ